MNNKNMSAQAIAIEPIEELQIIEEQSPCQRSQSRYRNGDFSSLERIRSDISQPRILIKQTTQIMPNDNEHNQKDNSMGINKDQFLTTLIHSNKEDWRNFVA